MLIGQVTPEREAIVACKVVGPGKKAVRVAAIIDTGFDSYLTLPPAIISELDLPFQGSTTATLGDGTVVALSLFLATIAWPGASREALILQADGGVLLGMAALSGAGTTPFNGAGS